MQLESQTLEKISSPYDFMTTKATADPQKTKQVSKDLLRNLDHRPRILWQMMHLKEAGQGGRENST